MLYDMGIFVLHNLPYYPALQPSAGCVELGVHIVHTIVTVLPSMLIKFAVQVSV